MGGGAENVDLTSLGHAAAEAFAAAGGAGGRAGAPGLWIAGGAGMNRLVALLTDFGTEDPYAGQVAAVVAGWRTHGS